MRRSCGAVNRGVLITVRNHATRKGGGLQPARPFASGSVTESCTVVLIAAVLGVTAATGCSRDPEPATAVADLPVAATQTRPATGPSGTTQPVEAWTPPVPPAARERVEERHRMVKTQIAEPVDLRTPVKDPRVLEAMRSVPRHVFVPAHLASYAYADEPLPIGHDQTISQPYIVALMTEQLKLPPGGKVLEIGTGSGYQAAVLAHLTPHVYTIEIVEPLVRRAEQTLRHQGYEHVRCRCGDGYLGWPEAAPFDGIIVTCAAEQLPAPLWEQLRPGGRIVIPLGGQIGGQLLEVITKTAEGARESETVTAVRFVPMTGKARSER